MDSGVVLKAVYQKRKKPGGWAELNPDLLDEIAKHIFSYGDYLRFRAVCKPWNITLPKISMHLTRPWLVLPFDDATVERYGYSDFSPMKKVESYLLRLPQLQNAWVCGSCLGWLITLTMDAGIEGELRILNPFRISHYFLLPPLSTFSHPADPLYEPFHAGKVILSSSPEEEEGFMAVAIYSTIKARLAFCRAGDVKWTNITKGPVTISLGRNSFTDVIFHQGKIYAIDGSARLYEYDMKTLVGGLSGVPQPSDFDRVHMPNFRALTNYLAVNPDGHLLLLVRHFSFQEKPRLVYETLRFDIFKLEETTRQWCKQSSLGNFVIFVGCNASTCRPAFVDEDGNCKKNCIYYTSQGFNHDFGVFNLDDGKSKQLFPSPTRPPNRPSSGGRYSFIRPHRPRVMAWI